MIPESAGATPYGIFLLADDYLRAARSVELHGSRYGGPVRLLAYHAAELFLKTYMRSAGETVVALRGHGHDLLAMVDRASILGLQLPPKIWAQARKMAAKNDYVRVRYVVTDDRSDIPVEGVLRFAETIRLSVIAGLEMDPFGVPLNKLWLSGLPSDYPGKPTSR